MLQPELHERSGPRELGEPQQCQCAGLRASRMPVYQVLCMENEQIWVQKQVSMQLDGPCRLELTLCK